MKELTVQELIYELLKVKDKSKWVYPPVYSVEDVFDIDEETEEDCSTYVELKGKP